MHYGRYLSTLASAPATLKIKHALPLAGAAILFALNLAMSHRVTAESGAVELYWARFYLLGYSDGATRRALLGQLVRWTAGAELSWLALNALAILVVLGVLALVAVPYVKRQTAASGSTEMSTDMALAIAAVFSGAASVVPLQLIGEPLQVCLLLALGYRFAVDIMPRHWRAPVGVAIAAITLLVHEAAAFIVIPFLYAVYCHRLRSLDTFRAAGFVAAAVLAPMALGYLLGHRGLGHGGTLRLIDGSVFHALDTRLPPPLPSLSELWAEEVVARFGSIRDIVKTASFVPRVGLPVLAAVTALAGLCRDITLPRRFTYLLVFSLPLYVIAHDWGRFATYTLLLALALPCPDSVPSDAPVQRRTALAACAVLMLCRVNRDYVMRGLSPLDFGYALGALLLCAAVLAIKSDAAGVDER